PSGGGWDEAGFDVCLGYGIDLRGIDDGVGHTPVRSRKPGIGGQEGHDVRIGRAVISGRKISLQLLRCENWRIDDRIRLNLLLPLVGEEEERPVLDDRPAQGRSELVALEVEPRKLRDLRLVEV